MKGIKNNASFRNQTKYYELKIPNTFSHLPKGLHFSLPKNSPPPPPPGTFTSWFGRICLLGTVNLSFIRTQWMPTSAINMSTFLFTHIWCFFHLVCARGDLCTRLWRNEHCSAVWKETKNNFVLGLEGQEGDVPEFGKPEFTLIRTQWRARCCRVIYRGFDF